MSFKKKCKYLELFLPVTEGITLLTKKGRKKHYIEDLIFKNLKKWFSGHICKGANPTCVSANA